MRRLLPSCLLALSAAAFAAFTGRAATLLLGVAFGLTDVVALAASGLGVFFEAFLGLRAAFMQRMTQQVVVEWSLYLRVP